MLPTSPVFAGESETAPRRASLPLGAHHPAPSVACLAAGSLLLLALPASAPAQSHVPASAGDPSDRAWHTSFTARFNARVLPSFRVDAELQSRLIRAWDGMVMRLEGRDSAPSPLDQYPLLGFTDDRFVVMRTTTPKGKETFVVRSEELRGSPTLSSTLVEYLDEVVYPSLETIAMEERDRIAQHPGYEPDLTQLAAQNPYQHGLAMRVPEMGPFKNRMVAFTGPGGRLTADDTAEYERRKWSESGGRQVIGVARPQRWGVAVELADLVQGGTTVARYRVVREVAAVEDRFIGEGRRGVLLRRPRLGSILSVSGCLADCDRPASWTRIHPDVERSPRQRRDLRADSPFDPRLPDASLSKPPSRPH